MTVQAPHEPSGAQPSFIERRPQPLAQDARAATGPRAASTETAPAVQREVHRASSRPSRGGPSGPMRRALRLPMVGSPGRVRARAVWPDPEVRPGIRRPAH